MTNHTAISDKHNQAITELRRLVRTPFETPRELLVMHQRVASERARTHRRILERIAEQAHVDLHSLLEDARRRNAAKRHQTTEVLRKVEARAAAAAKAEKERFHQIRSDYINSFGGHLPLGPGIDELKFHQPIQWSGEAQPGECNQVLGSWCGTPDFGSHEASAEIAPPAAVGIWLYPYINSDNGDCEETLVGHTFHELTYQMAPPSASFLVNSVRVDLIGNGLASSSLGDFSGLFVEANPLYEHTFVQLDVLIAQLINGQWQEWPLLSDKLFVGAGNYARQIRSLLSGQTYPASVVVRKPDLGAGEILCYVHLACSSMALGSDGRVRIDFRAPDLGIFVGGVTLIGQYV